MIRKIFITTTIQLSLFIAAHAQSLPSRLEKAFQNFSTLPTLKNGMASLTVIDMENGEVVFAKNEQIGLPTASTLKVITAATAFDILGKDFKFHTKLSYDGTITANGTLNGNIIITGSGDPTLGSDRYAQNSAEVLQIKWLEAIQKAGIKRINGNIIANDNLYGGNKVPGGWNWLDIGNYYGAGISALNWKENKVGLHFSTEKMINEPAEIDRMTEEIPYLTLQNETKIGAKGTGDNVYAFSGPYSKTIIVRGTYGKDLTKTIEISNPDPAYTLAYSTLKYFNNHHVKTNGIAQNGLSYIQNSNEKLLLETSSPSLSQIVYWFNQRSINLYGESLLKAIANYQQQTTDTEMAAVQLQEYWKKQLSIDNSTLNTVDGSGLSPLNRVTTLTMAKIMHYASHQSWYKEFYESLPVYNEMKMKSGTISGTLGYTGYQKNKDGKTYCFALLVNNYTKGASAMRTEMYKLLDQLK